MTEIKFCENNFTHGTDVIAKRLREEFKDVEVTVESCLGYCGDCAVGPYALFNDEMVQADTPEELYDMLVEQLE